MITMLLGGLWHGAGWTFVIWGGLHGLYLVVNHAWHALRRALGHDPEAPLPGPLHALAVLAPSSPWSSPGSCFAPRSSPPPLRCSRQWSA